MWASLASSTFLSVSVGQYCLFHLTQSRSTSSSATMQKCDGSFSKPNSDKFSHTAQLYFFCISASEFLQSRGGLEPKYNQYIGMAHSLCSGVRSDMQRAWNIDLKTNKQTNKQRNNKETKKQRNKETKKQRNKETKKQRKKERNKQTNKKQKNKRQKGQKTEQQKSREANKRKGKEAGNPKKYGTKRRKTMGYPIRRRPKTTEQISPFCFCFLLVSCFG